MDAFVSAVRAVGLAGQVPYLEGAPGIGKTEVVKALARDLDAELHVICLAQRAGNEIHGIPIVSKVPLMIGDQEYTVVRQSPPAYAVEAKTCAKKRVILFFDEFNQLSPTDAGQAMTIFSERLVGEIRLERNEVMMIAAGNPPEMSAGGWRMPAPVRRRLVKLPMEVDAKAWADPRSFPTNWGYPLKPLNVFGHEVPEEDRLRKRTMMAAWVHSKPDVFVNRDVAKMDGGYVCPATADNAADLLAAIELHVDKQHRSSVRSAVLTGCMGPIGCQGFTTFMDNMDVPDPREVLDNPKPFFAKYDGTKMDPAKTYYFLMALVEETRFRTKAHLADSKQSTLTKAQTAWYNALEIAGFLQKKGAPVDFLVMYVGNLQAADVMPKKIDLNKCPIIDEFAPLIGTLRASGFNWVALSANKPDTDPKKRK